MPVANRRSAATPSPRPRSSFPSRVAIFAGMTRHPAVRVALLSLATLAACRPRTAPVPSAATPAVTVVPRPATLTLTGGAPFVLHDSLVIVTDASGDSGVARSGNMLAMLLRASTGYAVTVRDAAAPPPPSPATPPTGRGQIRLRLDSNRTDLGEEGYALAVTPDSVVIAARRGAGVFHGVQTLRQLLPYQVDRDMALADTGLWKVPAVSILDVPRFAWRGAMLDVARHFFTVDEVKQYVDLLALYKLNVLHLHLSDDQGWRIEIKSRPALATAGGATQVGGAPGGFYTQDDYREIVRYAAERYVTIVPEIDMPAHTNAALAVFPDLSCGKRPPGTYTGTEVGFSAICPDKPESYALIEDVVREISAMTPGPYFHIGGDEVQALTPEQYASFIERVQGIVNAQGKSMIGWDEIRKARLVAGTVVQLWRPGQDTVASSGSRMILSPANRLYLDMQYTPATELGLHWAGYLEPRTVYDWDPGTFSPGIRESDILGVEAPLWTETVRNVTAAFYLAVPRLPAVAELGWTPQRARDWEDFRRRLAAHAPRWRLLGVNYYPSPQIPW